MRKILVISHLSCKIGEVESKGLNLVVSGELLVNIGRFLDRLEIEVMKYRVPVVDLIGVQSRDSYRVLIATILSSRTKDEVTAVASSRLFDSAPDIDSLAELDKATGPGGALEAIVEAKEEGLLDYRGDC